MTNIGIGVYSNCVGYFEVIRRGIQWIFSLYLDSFGKYVKIYSTSWIDNAETFARKISKVQMSTLAYGAYSPAYMELWDVKIVTEDVKVSSQYNIPVILRQGAITKNDLPFYEFLNPASTFIGLEKGDNGLMVFPPDGISDMTVRYTEREL